MDSLLANVGSSLLLSKLTSNSNETTSHAPGISIPGTIVGTLASVEATKSYMEKYAEYNNYVTSNYGSAQVAADRYMSLKERIPMSMEYYETPKKKKEILMYINPNKISISTQKLKQKVITRGGIYFHHFGDDTWQMNISGETGYSMMRGITKLEEAYYHSGALLKYKNISVNTIHTTNMLDTEEKPEATTAELLNKLSSMGTGGQGLASVIGSITDATGLTTSEKIQNADGKETTVYQDGSGKNIITKALDAANEYAKGLGANQPGIMQSAIKNTGSTNIGSFTGAMMTATAGQFSNAMSALSIGNLANSFAATAISNIGGGTGGNCMSVGKNFTDSLSKGVNNILNFATGNYDDIDVSEQLPSGSTTGNFYQLNEISAGDLGNIVSSASEYTNNHTIDKDKVSTLIGDLTEDLTDPYRPRMILIYFDDRVYIGHFDSFNWDRSSDNLSIQYSMVFTVVRQVNVGRSTAKESTTDSLKNMLAGAAVNVMFNGWKKDKTDDKKADDKK